MSLSALLPLVFSAFTAPLAACPPGVSSQAGPPATEFVYDGERLASELAALAGEHGELVTRHLVGTSRGGRAIEALRIAAPTVPDACPALLVVANLDGPRVFETGVAVDHARRLATGFAAGDEAVRALLDRAIVWIVPCANPDGAAARFRTPLAMEHGEGHGIDNDRDGRQGEDAPTDVNGDGVITSLRVPDPEGTWKADENEPRLNAEADRNAGERGSWKIWIEGRDVDGDERVAEDPLHDAYVNRNFPSGWQEHTPEGGLFPTDEPEVRALIELVLENPDIALVITYDAFDNLVEKPKSVKDDARAVKRIPPAGVLESDAALIEELGKRYRELTENDAKGDDDDAGTFQRWCYDHRGLVTLNAVLWELPTDPPPADEVQAEDSEAGADPALEEDPAAADGDEAAEEDEDATESDEPEAEAPARRGRGSDAKSSKQKSKKKSKDSDDAKRLAWIDASSEEAWRFRPWESFEHPDLGAVEVGGFAPYARSEPPVSDQAAIAERTFTWFLTQADVPARVELVSCTVEDLGGGVLSIEAALENAGFLPLSSRSGQRTRTTRPARVRLLVPAAATLLAGQAETLIEELDGSGGRQELSWLVHGPSGMEIVVEVDTDHAGLDLARPEAR